MHVLCRKLSCEVGVAGNAIFNFTAHWWSSCFALTLLCHFRSNVTNVQFHVSWHVSSLNRIDSGTVAGNDLFIYLFKFLPRPIPAYCPRLDCEPVMDFLNLPQSKCHIAFLY